jgi:hypothetical protein
MLIVHQMLATYANLLTSSLLVRWFGSIVIILGWIGLFAPVTKQNIQALLLGDIAWLWVFYIFIQAHGTWTFTALSSGVILVIFLALVRILYLLFFASDSVKPTRK